MYNAISHFVNALVTKVSKCLVLMSLLYKEFPYNGKNVLSRHHYKKKKIGQMQIF